MNATPENFIEAIIQADLKAKKNKGRVHTRFPPEPNGYLHLGHAKSLQLNFGLAHKYKGKCNLRLDDSNPSTEKTEFVASIQQDIRWLGYQWDELHYASDYFEKLYELASQLIDQGDAYICELSAEELNAQRGDTRDVGQNSPWRERDPRESRQLFEAMRAGEYPEGSKTLRAKIDMQSPNIILRDPVLYRIKHQQHHRTGSTWCIYPSYDFAHGQSDALEGITHSLCTLEFQDHRPLYDWLIAKLKLHPTKQYEFARLRLSHTLMSKRKLQKLIHEKHLQSWDDPRAPTLSGIRRRGIPPAALHQLCENIGVTKYNSTTDLALFEHSIRESLAQTPHYMAVLKPLKIILSNHHAIQMPPLHAPLHPKDPSSPTRLLPMGPEIYIEADDFQLTPPKKFFRLKPGGEVRLRNAYILRCHDVSTDAAGRVTELHASLDPETLGKNPEGRKVKGVLHWVDAASSVPAECRLYERLFDVENPEEHSNISAEHLNPNSQQSRKALLEPELAKAIQTHLLRIQNANPNDANRPHAMDAEARSAELPRPSDPASSSDPASRPQPMDSEARSAELQHPSDPASSSDPASRPQPMDSEAPQMPNSNAEPIHPSDFRFQCERLGWFCPDTSAKPHCLVLNRVLALKDKFNIKN